MRDGLNIAVVAKAKAYHFMRVREQGSNRGALVEHFQKTVDGKAQAEPWCAAFVCTLLKEVGMAEGKPTLTLSEHCMTLFRTNKDSEVALPFAGALVIWERTDGSGRGHAGVCISGMTDDGYFLTIEGNTSAGGASAEGDGVYMLSRSMKGFKGYKIAGFLDPWV
jgi:hypothetical protein